MTEQNKQPDLTELLRQYQHNDGSGLVFGYDKDGIDKLFASLSKQPPAEAGEGAVAWMSLYAAQAKEAGALGAEISFVNLGWKDQIPLYTSQTTATQAAVAAAKLECAELFYQRGMLVSVEEAREMILASIPADHMQALRELIEEAVSKGFDIGLRYQGCLENNAADADIAIEVDRILAEKGEV
jgi:hypothetical protein